MVLHEFLMGIAALESCEVRLGPMFPMPCLYLIDFLISLRIEMMALDSDWLRILLQIEFIT